MSISKPIRTWRDLEVWRRAHDLTLEVYRITRGFPTNERFRLVDQLCRAAASIPTNIAEGKGRHTLGDYLRFLFVARGSIEEIKYLILLARDLGYLTEAEYENLSRGYDRVGRMLNRLITALQKRPSCPSRPNTQHPTPNPDSKEPSA